MQNLCKIALVVGVSGFASAALAQPQQTPPPPSGPDSTGPQSGGGGEFGECGWRPGAAACELGAAPCVTAWSAGQRRSGLGTASAPRLLRATAPVTATAMAPAMRTAAMGPAIGTAAMGTAAMAPATPPLIGIVAMAPAMGPRLWPRVWLRLWLRQRLWQGSGRGNMRGNFSFGGGGTDMLGNG